MAERLQMEAYLPPSPDAPMCKSQGDTRSAQPQPRSAAKIPSYANRSSPTSASASASANSFLTTTNTSTAGEDATGSSSSRSPPSLGSLRGSLSDKPSIYTAAEISAATCHPLAKRLSSSSWRCSLRGRDSFILQRPFRGDLAALPALLVTVCKSHHRSLVRLLGASVSHNQIYLVYDYAPGASLEACLHNPVNRDFTPLSSWISRIQVAADLAKGLDYIHHHAAGGGTFHNRIKASTVVISDSNFNAQICNFGAALLAGEITTDSSNKMRRSDSRTLKIEGTRGYIAPEVIAGGGVSRNSDVFALGVVLLELISGEEPLKYRLPEKGRKAYEWVSLIETARKVIGPAEEAAERMGRVRRWVDRRLRDSFPVEVAEKLTLVALRCVETEAARRPSMSWVEGMISKLFLESKDWSERVTFQADISVSFAPR